MLREVAKRINAEMRVSDIGARFGGDEFSPSCSRRRICRTASVWPSACSISCGGTPIKLDGDKTENVTLSIGVAVAEPKHDTKDYKLLTERLLAEADAALYRSKQCRLQSRWPSRAASSPDRQLPLPRLPMAQ